MPRPQAFGGGPWGAASETLALTASDGVRLRAALARPLRAVAAVAPRARAFAGGGAEAPGAATGTAPAARGLALLLPGRTEFLEKYAPVVDALTDRGFAVAGLDWRGQGGSARSLGNPRKGHVRAFDEYRRDLDALVAAVAAEPGPRVMLAHSMAGAIALPWLAERPGRVAAALLSAPMWGLVQAPPTALLARALCRAASGLGLGGAYVLGGRDAPYPLSGFAGNRLTACAEGFAHIEAVTRAAPDHALGGPTWSWLRAAYAEMAALGRTPLTTPSLIFAGADDRIVALGPMRERAARGEARFVELPGARHEPLFETAATRARLWAEVDAFLAAEGL
jgi:lysophospholipase